MEAQVDVLERMFPRANYREWMGWDDPMARTIDWLIEAFTHECPDW